MCIVQLNTIKTRLLCPSRGVGKQRRQALWQLGNFVELGIGDPLAITKTKIFPFFDRQNGLQLVVIQPLNRLADYSGGSPWHI